MTRAELQRLARIRIKEANALLKDGHFEGAYYLAGYAVECALKACIAKQTQRYEFPDKKRADESHTHDLKKLVKLANLENVLQTEISANKAFRDNWTTVQRWSENTRYQTVIPGDAIGLHSAITDRKDGVLSWLKKYW
jgi:HEPN domain-containing protein